MALKILVIEDEPSLARILQFDLENAGYQVALAEDGDVGYQKAKENLFDCLIVDWMLPKVSGVDMIKRLRAEKHKEIIILLTAKGTELDVIEGLTSGADLYLKKPFSSRELLAQLKSLFNRFTPTNANLLQFGEVTIDSQEHRLLINGKESKATKIEFDLLKLMFENEGKLLTRDFLLNNIWGFDYDGSTRIVDVHISQLRTILEPTAYEIRSVHGIGYSLNPKKK